MCIIKKKDLEPPCLAEFVFDRQVKPKGATDNVLHPLDPLPGAPVAMADQATAMWGLGKGVDGRRWTTHSTWITTTRNGASQSTTTGPYSSS